MSFISSLRKKLSGKSVSRERIEKANARGGKFKGLPWNNNKHDDSNPDAPPAYTPFANTPGSSSAEDPYAYLSSFDTIFVIDDSGSMKGRRWREVRDVLASIAPVCASHDPDGIDVYFLNHKPPRDTKIETNGRGYINIRSADQVNKIFENVEPWGATPTGQCLNRILKPYIDDFEKRGEDEVKPINIIVITDGEPSDAPEEIIKAHARKLDKFSAPSHQVGIQFFQVGNDPTATKSLQQLDDGLSKGGDVRDMVDTVTWESRGSFGECNTLTCDGILKVVLGAVMRRFDNMTMKEMNSRHH